jgi:uncharacterized membrane-anchored protein YjiN (DUF445 family)
MDRHYGGVQTTVSTPQTPERGRRTAVDAPRSPLGTLDTEAKRRDLRRMKTIATGFLVGVTVVFLVAHVWFTRGGPGWVGYLEAAAEAGMVGALADWFAVTALFRRPLGLPIPHTAIIPTKKDQIGDSLGDFVGSNFLAEDVVRDKLRRTELSRRVGGWLAVAANAERATAELAIAARGVVTVLRDEHVQDVLEQVVVRQLMNQPWGPPLGRVLAGVLADGTHHKMVDLVCDRAFDWVRGNHDLVMRVVADHAPTWSPKFVDQLVADRVFSEVLAFTWAVKADAEHPMRQAVDKFLVEFAQDLRADPATIERTEQIKRQILAHPDVQQLIGQAWGTVKSMILDAAADPSSALRRRVADGIVSLGRRLSGDAEFQAKIDGWLEDTAGYVVRHYRAEITTLITDTVDRWDARETSRKVELQVGRDLQFIRINGTVVGALAGLIIYALAQLIT